MTVQDFALQAISSGAQQGNVALLYVAVAMLALVFLVVMFFFIRWLCTSLFGWFFRSISFGVKLDTDRAQAAENAALKERLGRLEAMVRTQQALGIPADEATRWRELLNPAEAYFLLELVRQQGAAFDELLAANVKEAALRERAAERIQEKLEALSLELDKSPYDDTAGGMDAGAAYSPTRPE